MGVKNNKYIPLSDTIVFKPNDTDYNPIYFQNNFIQFYDKRITVINDKNYFLCSNEKFKTDYLILANNAKVSIKDLFKQYSFRQIIIDSSNALWRTNKWIGECKELNIAVCAVNISGAFMVDI
jgi:hypothetical protein